MLHQHLVASHKLFKQSIRFISGKLSLIRVLPHGFSTHVVPDVFVHARSNVFMVILSKPFLKRVESSFFSLLSIDTGKNGSRHVGGLTVCKRLILQAKLTGIYTIWSAPRLGDPGPSGSGLRPPARGRPVRPEATTRSWSPGPSTGHITNHCSKHMTIQKVLQVSAYRVRSPSLFLIQLYVCKRCLLF